MAVAQFSDIVW